MIYALWMTMQEITHFLFDHKQHGLFIENQTLRLGKNVNIISFFCFYHNIFSAQYSGRINEETSFFLDSIFAQKATKFA